MISRAAAILRLLGQETDGLSLGQIASRVGLPRSTVQRIVAALTVEGFISTDKGYGGIRLGPEIQSLAQAAASGIRDRLRPIMKRISDETGETVDLAILDGDKMLFIDQIVGRQRLRAVSSIGESFPLTTTANGKAALACMDPARATRLILAELEGDSSKPLATILREVEDVRQGALARDESEHTDGVCALGLAIEDSNGDIYALSTPVPASRYTRIKDRLTDAIHRHLSGPV
ncbi:IclR family transcriptional regulator [uncultured Tateyamaria sp.]|uniref:IclR family transcriptional regulator n=1 Tax=uncultured Tateyamaria sp. TaxID=455651 RepID=UPI0026133209|nr:IclR family transcriptional regulator [uncultured Tateyamaria sp.]